MQIDISRLLNGESTISPLSNGGEAVLSAETSECCFGTFNDQYEGIHTVFYLSNPFTKEYYNGVGLSPETITEGDTEGFRYVGISTASQETDSTEPATFYTESDLEKNEWYEVKKGGYIVYPMAESASGQCWDVGDGLKKIIWFSQPELEVVNTTSNSATVHFSELEQYLSLDNYSAIAITIGDCGRNWEGYEELSHPSAEKTIDFRSSIRKGNLILTGLPAGTLHTFYFYKKTPRGRYYYMGSVEINTSLTEKPQCMLDIVYSNEIMENGVECINYPNIFCSDWQRFCDDINLVRLNSGLSYTLFESVNPGQELSVDIFNAAAESIAEIYEHLGLDIPSTLETEKQQHQEITSEYFENLVDAIVTIRDALIWN